MVCKRQKEARKRLKESNPELFPNPEHIQPLDPNKKKKKHGTSKAIRMKPNSNKRTKPSFSKHPLRVAGMKPGECCYICKEKNHIAKDCPDKAQWEKNKICLLCRHRGHSLKNCPNKSEETVEKIICYNCGKTGHSLAKCPQPLQEGGTKFASCFICKGQGHLSKNCPQNTHGVYPKGGCCKICNGITHLARDCPNKGRRVDSISIDGDGHASFANEERPRGRVTKLTSGDDLEDDFSTYDTHTNDTDESVAGSVFDLQAKNVKAKKTKGGCCKICNGITHLARDCPNKGRRVDSIAIDGDGYASFANEERPRGRVTKLTSGDDLEDDFSTYDTHTNDTDESVAGSVFDLQAKNVKAKKTKVPKVVNFIG